MSPSTLSARALGLALALAAVATLGWLSRAPVAVGALEADGGVIRLAWRLRAEAGGEACRRPTAEELEALPPHMRNPDACLSAGLAFALSVTLDGAELVADTLEPAGARGDRPVFVLRDLPVEAGLHHLSIRFVPLGDGTEPYSFDESVRVAAGRVALVTFDSGAGRLVLREEREP